MWKLAIGSVLVFIIGTAAAVWMVKPVTVYSIDFCLSCGGAKYRVTPSDSNVTFKRCGTCSKRNTPEGDVNAGSRR